jgi:uncharacterized surface protein with fasciclin (FAS1) repeats
MKNFVFTKSVPLFLIFLFGHFALLQAQISSTASGGNWSNTATWVGGVIPQASDNVIIAAGASVELDVAGACNNLTANGTLNFSTASRSFSSAGTTTINNGGRINFTTTTTAAFVRSFNDIIVNTGGTWLSTSLVTLNGNLSNSGSFTTSTSGTITFAGSNKTINGSSITISAIVNLTGTYSNASTDLKIEGNFTGTGSLTNLSNSSLILGGATNNLAVLVASASPNTVSYTRAGNQTVIGTTYHTLNVSGTGTKTLQSFLNINNRLDISAESIFYDNGFQVSGTTGSTLKLDGTFQIGAALATSFPTSFSTITINNGSTIHFSTTNALGQQIPTSVAYFNLRVSGTSVKSLTGNLTIPGSLTISSGTFDVGQFNITVNGNLTNTGIASGAGKIILSGGATEHSLTGTGTYTNLELNDNSGASLASNLTVEGTLSLTRGALKTLSRLVTLNGNIEGNGVGFFSIGLAESGDIVIGGSAGGNFGSIYMADAPNNAIRRFTINRKGAAATLTFARPVIIKDQLNLINGNIDHFGNLTLGTGATQLTTTIVNGTIATPPVFNTFTGLYRLQYGDGVNALNADLETGAQGEIPPSNTVDRVTLNLQQNKVTLTNDLTVTGAIVFTRGNLFLGEKNLFTTYTGAGATGSTASYIVTNGSGQFYRNIPVSTTGTFNFPVGTSTNFSNVLITFVDNSNMTAGKIGTRVVKQTPQVGQTASYLNKYWVFSDDRTGGTFSYKPTFTFDASEVTGTTADLKIGRFTPTQWDVFPATKTTTTITLQTGSIILPLTGNGVVFSALSDPVNVTPPANVWEVIVNSDVHNTLETAVLLAELNGALQGQGPFTVFAPTDAAFNALPDGVLASLLADPAGALTNILKYHVVSGVAATSSSLTNGQVIPTLLAGKNVTVRIEGSDIFINDSKVIVADITTANGIVHVIDAVLTPGNPATVWDIIVDSDVHNTLETAVLAAGLDGALEGQGPFTVFAPTDAAFQLLPEGALASLLADPTGALANVLKYHVIAGTAALSTSLTDGQIIPTLLAGKSVVINIDGSAISVNNAQVTIADLQADNGVVHVINAVLLPDDVSISDPEALAWSVFPNPANGSVFIRHDDVNTGWYELLAIDGKQISSGQITQNLTQLNTSELVSGVYMLRINTGKNSIVKRIAIN